MQGVAMVDEILAGAWFCVDQLSIICG